MFCSGSDVAGHHCEHKQEMTCSSGTTLYHQTHVGCMQCIVLQLDVIMVSVIGL